MAAREAAAAVVVALPFGLGLTAAAGDDPAAERLFRFADPEIVESSGLVAQDGLFFTVNDSGDGARVFTVDGSGRTVGVSRWAGDPVDVEALAPESHEGSGRVLVGDIGDNEAQRRSITLTSVRVGRGDPSGDARPYRYDYPGGPADAETLMVDPRTGHAFVVTKSVLGGQVLQAPTVLDHRRVNRMELVGRVMALATDGAFFPDGRHVVVRDYTHAVVYTFPELEQVGEVPLPEQQQGEAIAVADDGRLVVSSEGLHAPVYAVDLPAGVARAVEGDRTPGSPAGSASDDPPAVDPPAAPTGAEPAAARPNVTSWLVGAGVLLAMLVVLLRSLRPR